MVIGPQVPTSWDACDVKREIRESKMAVSPARAAAFDILLRVEREASFASELLHSVAYEGFSAADHGLTTELVMGVLRWRSGLDADIAGSSAQPMRKLDLEVLIALRLGLYQLRWLNRIPARAAINESVELVKRARKRSAAPFVNALLRKLSKLAAQPAKEYLSGEDLAQAFAHPLWLVERWAKGYGLAAAHRICQYSQTVPVTAIRLYDHAAENALQKEAVVVDPGALLASARRIRSGDVTRSQAFAHGQIAIQDEGSQLIAVLVGKGARILDCCAAPGGKTMAMAQRDSRAQIIAVDLHPQRAHLMRRLIDSGKTIPDHAHADTSGSEKQQSRNGDNESADRSHSAKLEAGNIFVVSADARRLPFNGKFDRVLADVPCSGTGTLARHPEIKWRLKPEDLDHLHARQLAILRGAMNSVAAGGRVIYSTCSLEIEENENVVAQALAEDNSFRLLDCRVELERLNAEGELVWSDLASLTRGPYLRTLPGVHPCDGFFAAIMEKV
jgi:16S rRNA (cytosine967-C5)-methyltransferase